jgi:hypothetical protein
VRIKKTKKPARSIRYLLSANPKLQKISLKKLAARGKRRVKRTRKARAKREPIAALPEIVAPVVQPAALARTPDMPVQRTSTPWGVALAVVALTAAAVLVAVLQTPATEPRKIDVTPEARMQPPSDRSDLMAEKKPVSVTAPPKLRSPEPDAKAEPVANVKQAVKAEPAVKVVPVDPPVHLQSADLPPKAAPHPSSVAITGCVARDDDTFWLKDTTGIDAPKSRSWKSGFLKKRTSNVELVDADHTLTLSSYVGQRVTATGTLADREMRARALQRVAPSCS